MALRASIHRSGCSNNSSAYRMGGHVMGAVLILLAVLVTGFIMGYFSKGINVTINKNGSVPVVQEAVQETVDQNNELVNMFPNEVTKWFQENNGMIK